MRMGPPAARTHLGFVAGSRDVPEWRKGQGPSLLARGMAWQGPLNPVGDAVYEIPSDYKGQDGNLRMRVPGRIIARADLVS